MPNLNKSRAKFFLVFKNIPYSDDEWEWDDKSREKMKITSPYYARKYPERCQARTTRPCHSFKYGPAVRSHKEARAACEKAIKQGAQMAKYTMYTDVNSNYETWAIRKGGKWYQIKNHRA